jgi:Integrase core domain
VEPRPQRRGPSDGLRGGEDQDPAEEPVALLGDAARPDAIYTGADSRRQADVAGHRLGVSKAGDVAQFEDEHRGDEGADAGNCTEPLSSRCWVSSPSSVRTAICDVRLCRCECLDHVLILHAAHLRRLLQGYIGSYNTARPHQSLDHNSPQPRKVHPPELGRVVSIPLRDQGA